MQQMQHIENKRRGLRAAMTSAIALAVVAMALSAQPVAARAPAQVIVPPGIVPPGCAISGNALQPTLRAGNDWAWAFAANFDQPLSATQVRTCLALRSASTPTVVTYYQSTTHCVIMNNLNSMRIGDGRAAFDGNMYLRCTVNLPGTWIIPPFAVETQSSFPSSASAATHTFFSSASASFRATTQALTCLPTLQSTYGGVTFSNSTNIGCATFSRVKTMLDRNPQTNLIYGWHRAGATVFAKQQLTMMSVNNPAAFTFDISAQGDGPFVMDWIHVDPGNHSGQ
jgi:hypothetical protein